MAGSSIRLGLDVGGVLSVMGGPRHADGEEWRSVMPGAWPFIYMFTLQHGPESLAVISRVNKLPREGKTHWVQRLASAVGLPR